MSGRGCVQAEACMSLDDKVAKCKVNSTFDGARCMSVYSVFHKVSHFIVKVTEVRMSSIMKLVSVNSIKTDDPPPQCSLFVFRLTLGRLMSYIYGAPILDVSRSHTTMQHSR